MPGSVASASAGTFASASARKRSKRLAESITRRLQQPTRYFSIGQHAVARRTCIWACSQCKLSEARALRSSSPSQQPSAFRAHSLRAERNLRPQQDNRLLNVQAGESTFASASLCLLSSTRGHALSCSGRARAFRNAYLECSVCASIAITSRTLNLGPTQTLCRQLKMRTLQSGARRYAHRPFSRDCHVSCAASRRHFVAGTVAGLPALSLTGDAQASATNEVASVAATDSVPLLQKRAVADGLQVSQVCA